MPNEVMSVREVAEFLGMAEGTVYKKVRRGELPAVRIGRSLRFLREAMVKWLESNTQSRRAEPLAAPEPGGFTVTTGGALTGGLRREELYHGR